jgi:hypothetical protein
MSYIEAGYMPEKKAGRLKIKISFGCTSEGVSACALATIDRE